jgi:hypothetical protein
MGPLAFFAFVCAVLMVMMGSVAATGIRKHAFPGAMSFLCGLCACMYLVPGNAPPIGFVTGLLDVAAAVLFGVAWFRRQVGA